ncbi:hypothetical protein RB595_005948 [Gaeumannomyces hyphopodioides]
MRPPLNLYIPLVVLCAKAAAQGNGRPGHGLIGYGTEMYNPPCAYTCGSMAVRFKLDCGDDHRGVWPSPECLAANDPYLQTAAWCIHTHCHGVAASKLEWFWETELIGHEVAQPSPKYGYTEALARARTPPPTAIAPHDQYLNGTSLVDEETYLAAYNGNRFYEVGETITSGYAIFLFVICVAIPVALSWLVAWLPLPRGLEVRVYGWLIDPPALGSRHAAPAPAMLGLGLVPTRGQALYLGYVLAVNVVLCSTGYVIVEPHGWYGSVREQVLTYVANRTGHLSLANLALAVLFSGRNGALLRLTGWSYGTFLLLHGWVAVICALQAAVHSALYLAVFLDRGGGVYVFAATQAYWLWGVAATALLVALVPLSALPLRRRFYEAFLASHVVLSALALAACACHIYYRYQWQWGYEIWVWIACAFWASDRLVARPWRVLVRGGGVKRAFVTVVDGDYLRLDIPGCRESSGHVYLYFPTLTWRVWENHPFSVAAPTALPGTGSKQQRRGGTQQTPASSEPRETGDAVPEGTDPEPKTPSTAASSPLIGSRHGTGPGATFYLRRRGGLTAALARQTHDARGIAVLVEAAYGVAQTPICPAPRATARYPNLICVAGGVGIAAALPLVRAPRPLLQDGRRRRRRLFWGVRTAPLVLSVQELLGEDGPLPTATGNGSVGGVRRARWGDVDVAVSVGARFDLPRVLEDALRESEGSGGTIVMVCGPPGMADEVRVTVAAAARKGMAVRLMEESFSW